jgi:hypothetical protein
MRRTGRFVSEFSLERLEMKLSPSSLSFAGGVVSPAQLDDPLPDPEPPPPPDDPPIPWPPVPPSGPIGPG